MEIGISGGSKNTATRIENFYGLNRGRRPLAGEMEDMINMSSCEYPCASPRGGREAIAEAVGEILTPMAPDEAFTDEITGFTGVSGNAFYYNGVRKTTIVGSRKTNTHQIDLPAGCEWEIKRMGDLCILNGYCVATNRSYMFYYNIRKDTFAYGGAVMPKMIVMIGNDNTGTYIEALKSVSTIKDYVINYSDGTSFNCYDYRELYHAGSGVISWEENLFSKYFKAGDELRIEGFRRTNEGQHFEFDDGVIVPVSSTKNYTIFNTADIDDTDEITGDVGRVCSMIVKSFSKVTDDSSRHKMYVDTYNINGEECQYSILDYDASPSYYAGVDIYKKIPTLNRICVHQGRIWGSSPSGRYIYASASDDIFSFSDADMTSGFAWRMPADTAGAFTNFSSYNGELIAFKPQAMSIISGYNTRNYQMHTITGIGCISPNSTVTTNKGIMFLSYDGFYIYNGSLPKMFGRNLNKPYTDAVAGFDGRKYYAAAVDSDGNREIVVYDTHYGVWHIEDDFDTTGFFRFRDGFYVCDSHTLYKTDGTGDTVEWSMTMAQVGDFDLMGINEVWVRAEIGEGAEFTVYSDIGDGKWREHTTFSDSDGIAIYRAPVRFAHADNYRVAIKGRGKVIIYGIELVTATGGRRHKERL